MNKGVHPPQGSTSGLRELLPVGTPLSKCTYKFISPELALAILEDNIEFIHLIIVLLTLFERKTFKRESVDALLNTPSRNTPRAYSLLYKGASNVLSAPPSSRFMPKLLLNPNE